MPMPRHAMSGATRATVMTFDRYVGEITEGLLSADEEGGLVAALKPLWALAEEMGVVDKPLSEWRREEIMRFLTLAVRAAVPLRQITHLSPDLNDQIPFG